VRLGIQAPTNVVVDREEVHVRKQRDEAAMLNHTTSGAL
jgi:sRNA-binding carbon storage regulator CsrA